MVFLLPLHHLGISEAVVAADEHPVARLQSIDDLIELCVLPPQLDGHAAGTMPLLVHAHDPLPSRLGVETAARDDETTFGLSQFNLQAERETRAKRGLAPE